MFHKSTKTFFHSLPVSPEQPSRMRHCHHHHHHHRAPFLRFFLLCASPPHHQQSPTRSPLVLSLATPQPPPPYATSSPHQPPTHSKPSPMRKSYRSILTVLVPWSLKKQRGQRTRAKRKKTSNFPPAGARTHHLFRTYARFRDEDLRMMMRIPAPHEIEGYAPGIPAAGPSSGVNQSGEYSTPRSRPCSWVGMLLPPLQLQLQPQLANGDYEKRHGLDKITEEELRKRSPEGKVEDAVSSFEEVKVQKKLVKEGKIEVMENPRFMTGETDERLREEKTSTSTPMEKEKRKFCFFPYPHRGRNESEVHAAATIQHPVVEHEEARRREVVTGTSAVPTASEGGSPSSKATGSPPKPSGSPSKGWFIGGLKGFFGARQPCTSENLPIWQHSTKTTTSATNTTTITAVFNNRYLPSGDDSDVEANSPSKLKGFRALFSKSPAKPKTQSGGDRKTRTNVSLREIASERRENTFDGVSSQRVGLGGAVKDTGVVGLRAGAVTVVLGARLGCRGRR
jgi:hypothetical protein